MKYKHIVLYPVQGLVIPVGESDRQLISDLKANFNALLTGSPNSHCLDSDRSNAVANLLLNWMFGGQGSPGPFTERVNDELRDIQEVRQRKFGQGAFLILQREGEISNYSPNYEVEHDDFVTSFGGILKEPIRSESRRYIVAALTALAVVADSVSGITSIADSVILYRDDGKPVYSFSHSGSATLTVSYQLEKDAEESVQKWYQILLEQDSFERVSRLLTLSLKSRHDNLRAFLFGWMAFEIFISNTNLIKRWCIMDGVRSPWSVVRG